MVRRSGKNANSQVLKILIGNKCDLGERKEIRKDEGEAFAMKKKQFMEISAKKIRMLKKHLKL